MRESTNYETPGARPGPFFIVGCPRSGTTLLSVLLDRHSKIAVTPETSFYDDSVNWTHLEDAETLRGLLSEWRRLPELKLDADAVVAACPPAPSRADVLATILSLYVESCGKLLGGEKTPQHLWHSERIFADFPNSLIFCLLRDGRDVALSLAAMPWWKSGLRGAAQYWLDAVARARRLSGAHPDRFIVVRYEQLVAEPRDALGAILGRLGLDFEPRQLVAGGETRVILPRSLAWKGDAAGPIQPERIGTRQASASAQDLAFLEKLLGPTLQSLGYASATPESSPDAEPLPSRPASEAAAPPSPPKPLQEAFRPQIGLSAPFTAERSRLHRAVDTAGRSPRLTVSILTRDSASRLGRLIDEVSCFADEIVVGVDAASSDETLAIASELADKAYRFAHPPGQLSGARMLIFRYATGDWILSIDDDESISDSFDEILPELLGDPAVTNFWFPRQWIVDRESFAYLHKPPWYPDWQLRLFRNDPTIVWKPDKAHSGYYVQGLSRLEPRAVIHHFEPVLLDADARARKLAMYRAAGSSQASELQYVPLAEQTPRAPASPRRGGAPRPRGRSHAAVDPDLQTPPIRRHAAWGSRILRVDMSSRLDAGDQFAAEVWARNTGDHSWTPDNLSMRGAMIRLSHHLLSSDGEMLKFDNIRVQAPKLVRPHETVKIIFCDLAPAEPGRYIFEWDFLCEYETWFAPLGSPTHRTLVEVA